MRQAYLIQNLEAAAGKLAGRPVIVRLKSHPGVLGLAQRQLDGRAVIDLDPALFLRANLATFKETFCHECAHVKAHFHQLPRRDPDQAVGREISKAQAHIKAGNTAYTRHESEADQIAAGWLKTLDRYHWDYWGGRGDEIIPALKVLYLKAGEK